MNFDIWIVTSVLAATIIAFVLDRFRMEVVALVSLLVLTLSGILTPAEATADFSNSLVLMIAGCLWSVVRFWKPAWPMWSATN